MSRRKKYFFELNQKYLYVFRLEAVRTWVKKIWQESDCYTINSVASEIPNNILQEDSKLLLRYDQAVTGQ